MASMQQRHWGCQLQNPGVDMNSLMFFQTCEPLKYWGGNTSVWEILFRVTGGKRYLSNERRWLEASLVCCITSYISKADKWTIYKHWCGNFDSWPGLRKTFFSKKTTHLFFFQNEQDFLLSLRKNLILQCFYCIMQYHYFQNYTIITCYTYYAIQIRRWRNVLHLCFCKLLVNSLQSGMAWQECSQQTKKNDFRTNSAVYLHALLVQHL